MDLLEEMLRYRDYYERYKSDDLKKFYLPVLKNLNESIDKVICEGMQKRRN